MRRFVMLPFLCLVTMLAACATVPTGPSVMSLPGTGKSFDQFRVDDATCRQFAFEQIGGVSAQQSAQQSAVSSAIVGTALGAAAGAAIGSATGDMGSGAAIGAGTGLILGSATGSSYASGSYYESQRRYDNAYMQCMYAKGNRVPVYGRFTDPEPAAAPGWDNRPPADYPPPPRSPRY